MKTFFFDSGLPRSGSTLFSAILNQNPVIHAGPISPVFELMHNLEVFFDVNEQAKAYPKPECNHKIISSVLENYYSDTDKPYVIDKSRAYSGQIPFIQKYITETPRILCTVRNPLDILASFIDLIHKNPNEISFIDKTLQASNVELTDNNRCDFLMSPAGVVFNSINGIAKAFYEKNHSCLYLIDYDELIESPEKVMKGVYEFLELESYPHTFENIQNVFRENDKEIYGISTMHEVKPSLVKTTRKAEEVLSPYVINKYKNLDFWNKK
jgi:sulfotransferase